MKKNPAIKKSIAIPAQQMAVLRMDAIRVAANLRDAEVIGGAAMMGGGGQMRPGKTAEQVVTAAEKIIAFVIAPR